MPAAHHVQAGTMSPSQAAHVASRGRKLLRAGRITHAQFTVLDALLWSGRDRGTDTATVAYDGIMKLAHCCRSTVAKTITRLVALGIVQKTKRAVLAIWKGLPHDLFEIVR
jgi:CRP-like cAMP-binding protein